MKAKVDSVRPLTVDEASAMLGMGPQMIRWQMRHGKLPIGICIRSGERWKYIVYTEWLNRWLSGDPVQIPKGMSDIEGDA